MEKIFYVDSKEIVVSPKAGEQFVAWYNRSSQNNPGGIPHVDVINGQQVQLRAFDSAILEKFIRTAYARTAYIKVVPIFEDTLAQGDDK